MHTWGWGWEQEPDLENKRKIQQMPSTTYKVTQFTDDLKIPSTSPWRGSSIPLTSFAVFLPCFQPLDPGDATMDDLQSEAPGASASIRIDPRTVTLCPVPVGGWAILLHTLHVWNSRQSLLIIILPLLAADPAWASLDCPGHMPRCSVPFALHLSACVSCRNWSSQLQHLALDSVAEKSRIPLQILTLKS